MPSREGRRPVGVGFADVEVEVRVLDGVVDELLGGVAVEREVVEMTVCWVEVGDVVVDETTEEVDVPTTHGRLPSAASSDSTRSMFS